MLDGMPCKIEIGFTARDSTANVLQVKADVVDSSRMIPFRYSYVL